VSFYLGNNPYTRGTYVPPPEFGGTPEAIDIVDSRRIAEAAEGRSLTASEISRYWYRRSFDFLSENPGRAAALYARKIALYFNDYEIPLDVNYAFDRRLFLTLRLAPFSFGLLLALAAAGAFLIPREARSGRILVLYVLANAAAVIAFFVCARYRQTAVPAVAILAALAVARLAREARERRWRALAAVAAGVAAAAVFVHLPVYLGRETSAVRSTISLGRAEAADGDRVEAERLFRDALRMDPRNVDANMNLGLLLYEARGFREAADAFAAAAGAAPGFAGAWNNLGNALRESGDLAGAVGAIRAAVRADSSYAGAWNNLGYTFALSGEEAEAERAYRAALRIDPGSVDARANLSDLLFRTGRFEEAVATLDAAARARPSAPALLWKRERMGRAAALCASVRDALGRGDAAAAGGALREALAIEGAPVRAWAERDAAARALLGGAATGGRSGEEARP
jgi:tetratricopeptide (TPR) repeat protein